MSHLYMKVEWIHDFEGDPIWIYAELDSGRMETRKVEIYKNGRCDRAGEGGSSGETMLGIWPYPSLEEIAADPQFRPALISKAEFEAAWHRCMP